MLGQVASGSATQGFGWEKEKQDLRMSTLTNSNFLGEEQLGKLEKEGENQR